MTNREAIAPNRMKTYSDDRISLADQIAETLKARGCWVPQNHVGPDLIAAVARAADEAAKLREERDTLRNGLLSLARSADYTADMLRAAAKSIVERR